MDYGANRISFRLAFRPIIDAFQFHGRSTRTEVVSFWLLGLLSALFPIAVDLPPTTTTRLIGALWSLLWGWPWIPLLIRRLHDQGRTNWLIVVALLPIVIFALEWTFASATIDPSIVGTSYSMSLSIAVLHETKFVALSPFTIAGATAFAILIAATFFLYILPGTEGPNRYGPDPRQ